MGTDGPKLSCSDYHVAWICPLADVELLPAYLMLDEKHTVPSYDTHYDENAYTCGSIGGHTVVIATCPKGETGNVNAGRLTGAMFKTFPNIRMAVLVGIGGGIPSPRVSEEALDNIHLGDVVVGWPGDGKPACVYHERGRAKSDHFELVGAMQNPDWRLTSALTKLVLDDETGKTNFDKQLARLKNQKKKKKFAHPGLQKDKLYKATHNHVGDYWSDCAACDESELVQRPQRTEDDVGTIVFHQGRIATGNAVVQDAKLRDEIRMKCDGALCVEMEAAGVDANRRCLVIRGISDYADSHKSDVWRLHAAGNAAAFARELLCRVQPATVKDMETTVSKAPWLVPLPRPQSFVGRELQLKQLSTHVSSADRRRLAIHGLGGCGKTALALEIAYRARQQQPKRAIFWVPAVTRENFEQAYLDIAILLRIPGCQDAKADVKQLVMTELSNERAGLWLMIVDNADDIDVLFTPLNEKNEASRLIDYIPKVGRGSVVFTTRTTKNATDLAGNNLIQLGEMGKDEAVELLKTRLRPEYHHQLADEQLTDKFLSMLTFFALAIVQAVAFINRSGCTLSDYISIYEANSQAATRLLNENFEDEGRYNSIRNAVTTTWALSFEQIKKHDQLASEFLLFIAFIANNDIPASMLPEPETAIDRVKAIGTLKAYAFITQREFRNNEQEGQQTPLAQAESFDMHPLVHLATRRWLEEQNQWDIWAEKALDRMIKLIPHGDHTTRVVWTTYLPHALHISATVTSSHTESRAQLLERVGYCQYALGQYSASEKSHRDVLAYREETLSEEHPDTLFSMNQLGQALSEQRKLIEAEQTFRKILALSVKISGKEHPRTWVAVNNLGTVLVKQEKYVEAEQMLRRTLESLEKMIGKEHPNTLRGMHNLASVLSEQGRSIEAEQMLRRTIALSEKLLGKEHPDTLRSMYSLATTLREQGKYLEAEEIFRKTLVLTEKVLGKEHPYTLSGAHWLAFVLEGQHRYEEALLLYHRGYEGYANTSGPDHPYTRACAENYARVREMADGRVLGSAERPDENDSQEGELDDWMRVDQMAVDQMCF